MLELKNVTKAYGNFVALKDVNLRFESGIYALLAPNGAGKSTLMNMLAMLMKPTEGEILWEGTSIWKLDQRYRDLVGFLPQDFGYYKDDTAEEYLQYIGYLKGVPSSILPKRIEKVLEIVGLSGEKRKMKAFSGGMVQRVGIAQALLNEPRILLLDEPTAGLDPKERVRFRNILSRIARESIVIISTHIVSDIAFVANHIIFIKDQQIYFTKPTREVCDILRDKVYEIAIDERQEGEYFRRFRILERRQEGRRVVIRFVAEKETEGIGAKCDPTVEDVFLYVYGGNGL